MNGVKLQQVFAPLEKNDEMMHLADTTGNEPIHGKLNLLYCILCSAPQPMTTSRSGKWLLTESAQRKMTIETLKNDGQNMNRKLYAKSSHHPPSPMSSSLISVSTPCLRRLPEPRHLWGMTAPVSSHVQLLADTRLVVRR